MAHCEPRVARLSNNLMPLGGIKLESVDCSNTHAMRISGVAYATPAEYMKLHNELMSLFMT